MLPEDFKNPPRSLSLAPFWFWNDHLDVSTLLRQLAEFDERGIHAFVIHPRIGLTRDFSWMSEKLLDCMRVVIEEAERRNMMVILYDEGMYPSGSSCGQVVAENPAFACRGLVMQDSAPVDSDHNVLYSCVTKTGREVFIVDRPIESAIRGLHFTGNSGDEREVGDNWLERRAPEDRPPATDLLNPEAVACFVRLVYQRYHDSFGEHFGKTIPAIFTDEPFVVGRFSPYRAKPGTTDILEHVNRILGYDFTPHLPALWLDDEPDALRYRKDYRRAIYRRLEETYYRTLSNWCEVHGVALTGHPELPDDIGHLRHFQWPGQDVILKDIMPGELAVTGPPSTQAKCAASSAIHLGRSRNLNEFMGAYGEDVPFSLYQFVANWLLVRGCNLMVPHAFFYSTRGARIDDCPPQLGPHGKWWHDRALVDFHKSCQRLCWINFESQPRCRVAVLGRNEHLPEKVARVLYENQIDFHYLEDRHLWEEAVITKDAIELGPMRYDMLVAEKEFMHNEVFDAVSKLKENRRVLVFEEETNFVESLKAIVEPVVRTESFCPWLRTRIVEKNGLLWCMLFNEGTELVETKIILPGPNTWQSVDPSNGAVASSYDAETLQPLSLACGEIQLMFSLL